MWERMKNDNRKSWKMHKELVWLCKGMILVCLLVGMFWTFGMNTRATEVISGSCGENVTYVLTDDGTLTISGTGDMYDFKYVDDNPWRDRCKDIVVINILEGVTNIEAYAFGNCEKLQEVVIPDSVTRIEWGAFDNCKNLQEIVIPYGVTSIEDDAFAGCLSLKKIVIPASVTSIGYTTFWECGNLTIYCVENSTAHTYAIENDIPYILIDSSSSEEDFLREAFLSQSEGNIIFFFCEDFDNNGTLEAFGGTGDYSDVDGLYSEVSLYYISNNGNVSRLNENYELYGLAPSEVLEANKHKFVVWEKSAGGSGSSSYIYGVKEGAYYEPEISRKYQMFGKEGEKFVGYESTFESGYHEWIPIEFRYNPSTQQFEEENASLPDEDDVIPETENQRKWIQEHLDYVASEDYEKEIVAGFSGRMLPEFGNITSDGDIKAYNILDSVTSFLSAEGKMNESDIYQLILADILYRNTDEDMMQELYAKNVQSSIVEIIEFLSTNTEIIAEFGDPEVYQSLLTNLNILKSVDIGTDKFNVAYDNCMKAFTNNISFNNFKVALSKNATLTALGIVVDKVCTEYEAQEDILQYVYNCVAYHSTSEEFKEVMVSLAQKAKKMNNESYYPLLSEYDGKIDWNALQRSIDDYIDSLEEFEENGVDAFAKEAMEIQKEADAEFGINALKKVGVAAFDTVIGLIPVVNTYNTIKVALNAGQLMIEILTNADDKAYALEMIVRIYCMIVLMDSVVDDYADNLSKTNFKASTVFDESVNVYRAVLLNASEYFIYYVNASLDDVYRRYISPFILGGGNRYDRQRIENYQNHLIMLKEQQEEIEWMSCHSPFIHYDSNTGDVIYYNIDNSNIFIVACPVDVTVSTNKGEEVIVLSGADTVIPEEYENYIRVIETEEGSGDYIKVAVVPKDYEISIEGTGSGTMDAIVLDYTNGVVSEPEYFLDIPITDKTNGYFTENPEEPGDELLIIDDTTYISEKEEACEKEEVHRIYGTSRYETSYAIANKMKEQFATEKFDTIIVANGKNFPDALAGSYLARVKCAPILMASEKTKESLQSYIKDNLKSGGTIYVLGGAGAVSENILKGLSGYKIKRLAGTTRYETNLLILEEAGVAHQDILICTGKSFADSLSASATGKPILLLNNKELTKEQKEFLKEHTNNQYYIIGGEGAVSKSMESAIKNYGSVKRISGASRYETSVKVAEEFFEESSTCVLAWAKNFPDGLCGGPLAMNADAPLILTADGKATAASEYIQGENIGFGYVLGGNGALSDETVMQVFQLKNADEIILN